MTARDAPTGRGLLWLAGAVTLVGVASLLLLAETLTVRFERDVNRMVFNDNVELLVELRRLAGFEGDSLEQLLASSPEPVAGEPYVVVSIEEHRLWYRQGDSVLFVADVATGSGRVLEGTGSESHWRFETPRGRLTVESKELDPVWVAPDWHYVEQALSRGLGIVRLVRGKPIPLPDGGSITVSGADVVKAHSDGRLAPVTVEEVADLVSGGNLIVPPFGTNQRKHKGVLGTHRINIGDGYSLHGTNDPESIGRSVSHGCVRLRNEDIARLYEMVSLGTPVFIY